MMHAARQRSKLIFVSELKITIVYDDYKVYSWIMLSLRNFPVFLFLILLRVRWRS